MDIQYGAGKTKYGSGVEINLTGDEVARAIDTYLVAHGVYVSGARTITVNGELCRHGRVYVDPSGFIIDHGHDGKKISGRGPEEIRIGTDVIVTRVPSYPINIAQHTRLCQGHIGRVVWCGPEHALVYFPPFSPVVVLLDWLARCSEQPHPLIESVLSNAP